LASVETESNSPIYARTQLPRVKTTYHVIFGESYDDVTVGYDTPEEAKETARALAAETDSFDPYIVALRG
jgi:hypothetical protein